MAEKKVNRTMGDKCGEHLTVLEADDHGYRLVPCDSRCPQYAKLTTLEQRLGDWTDWDIAAWQLGVILGFFADDADYESFRENKHIFYTDNHLGNWLHDMLLVLERGGFIESDTERQRFKWKQSEPSKT